MGKQNRRLVVISFSRDFDAEYNFIQSLVNDGFNRSLWICNAIKEKIKTEKKEGDALANLEDRIKALEMAVNNGKVIVEENKTDKDLVNAVSIFEF